jgi:hypothetical protein
MSFTEDLGQPARSAHAKTGHARRDVVAVTDEVFFE